MRPGAGERLCDGGARRVAGFAQPRGFFSARTLSHEDEPSRLRSTGGCTSRVFPPSFMRAAPSMRAPKTERISGFTPQ